MTKALSFFSRYQEGANTFEPGLVASHFTPCFMNGDPNGVQCVQNDEGFLKAIPERESFLRRVGFKFAKVLDVAETALDERYKMAKVHWHLQFEKRPGHPQEFRFFVTYFLFDKGDGPKIAFYISHDDEMKTMRDAGLIPDDTPPR